MADHNRLTAVTKHLLQPETYGQLVSSSRDPLTDSWGKEHHSIYADITNLQISLAKFSH